VTAGAAGVWGKDDVLRALWRALRGFSAHRGYFLAAGLSFYFLICLIPLVLFLIAATGFVLSSESVARGVSRRLSELVPVYQREVAAVLDRVVEARELSGLVGTSILLLFSTQLFAALRLTMNDVFGVQQRRGFVHGILYDVLMIVVMAVLFLGSIVATDVVVWASAILEPHRVPSAHPPALLLILGLTFSTALFFITYRYFPARRVAVVPALAGAVFGSVLWEAAKGVFRWYILSLGIYDRMYGASGFLIALLMFVYYTAIVFLVGGEYAAALEGRTPED
jgi:membrane protein